MAEPALAGLADYRPATPTPDELDAWWEAAMRWFWEIELTGYGYPPPAHPVS